MLFYVCYFSSLKIDKDDFSRKNVKQKKVKSKEKKPYTPFPPPPQPSKVRQLLYHNIYQDVVPIEEQVIVFFLSDLSFFFSVNNFGCFLVLEFSLFAIWGKIFLKWHYFLNLRVVFF